MAEEPADMSNVAATFPDPPPFWRDFTAEKMERMEGLLRRYADQTGVDISTIIRVPDIPEDLATLQPPAEPVDGKWRVFNEALTLDQELQSLEAAGIERLVPAGDELDGKHIDRAFVLKRLAKSLLLNFLEWMGVMGIAPEQGNEKIQDLRTLLLNFHHVLNEYRPHQAREQLIALMQDQLDAKRAETAAVRAVVDKANRVLEGLGSIELPAGGNTNEPEIGKQPINSVQQKNHDRIHDELCRARGKTIWMAVDSDFS